MAKYLVTGRVFGKNGELLDGKVVESSKEIDHPAYSKVTATEAKKLEVATPKKADKE